MMNLKLKFKILERYPSQIAFAYDLGIDGAELSQFVRGWREPKPDLKVLIAKKLGCTPDEIFPHR
jgi:transcriptional regulator with XRE-family HTH domain